MEIKPACFAVAFYVNKRRAERRPYIVISVIFHANLHSAAKASTQVGYEISDSG